MGWVLPTQEPEASLDFEMASGSLAHPTAVWEEGKGRLPISSVWHLAMGASLPPDITPLLSVCNGAGKGTCM
jgi:hypothetical protein